MGLPLPAPASLPPATRPTAPAPCPTAVPLPHPSAPTCHVPPPAAPLPPAPLPPRASPPLGYIGFICGLVALYDAFAILCLSETGVAIWGMAPSTLFGPSQHE